MMPAYPDAALISVLDELFTPSLIGAVVMVANTRLHSLLLLLLLHKLEVDPLFCYVVIAPRSSPSDWIESE